MSILRPQLKAKPDDVLVRDFAALAFFREQGQVHAATVRGLGQVVGRAVAASTKRQRTLTFRAGVAPVWSAQPRSLSASAIVTVAKDDQLSIARGAAVLGRR